MTNLKDGGRNDRLSWSKRAEHRLREELKEIALKRCDDSVAKFAACARDKGMLVVFSCREQNALMNSCLNEHTNEESFERYKFEREIELHRETQAAAKLP
ncbi:unnamed protein product [Ectocarpus sp. 12 AP-2014]